MRLLAWNIRQGGGSRLARIADALARHEADVLVLSEYRGGEAAVRLLAALATLGYLHATPLTPPPGRSGVLIAARCAFRDHGEVDSGLPEPYRMVGVEFPAFRLVGIYMPNLVAKIPYWETLIATLGETGGHALAVGDFSTCRPYLDETGAIDRTAHYMDKMAEIGFCYGAAAIRSFGNIPGSAPEEMASASTTLFCRVPWSRTPARYATRTRSASPASPITLR
jgi:exonuclease III